MDRLTRVQPDGSPQRPRAAPAGSRRRILALAALALLAAAACVSTGTKAIVDPKVVAQIEVSKSTRVGVFKLIGLPAQVAYPGDGGEVWTYYYVTEAPQAMDYMILTQPWVGGFDLNSQRLTLVFNKNGVVQSLEAGKTIGAEGTLPY
jgi:outer membrane protein assembly factor BamE (lipoprotein component of BamABCDE complex)